jgi:hypothetical protein
MCRQRRHSRNLELDASRQNFQKGILSLKAALTQFSEPVNLPVKYSSSKYIHVVELLVDGELPRGLNNSMELYLRSLL